MYPVYDPCFACVPLLGGMAVGACLANEAYKDRVYRPIPTVIAQTGPQTVTYVPVTTTSVIITEESQRVLYRVAIPSGVRPGQLFLFKVGDKTYSARCPHGSFAGQELLVTLPLCPTIVTHPVAEPVYKEVAIPAVVAFDHVVDELQLENAKHGIIDARAGDKATILGGTIEAGLPAPYSEYCKVRIERNGKIGKVSRFVLKYDGVDTGTRTSPVHSEGQVVKRPS